MEGISRRALLRCCALREPGTGPAPLCVPTSRATSRPAAREDFGERGLAALGDLARGDVPPALGARIRELEWCLRGDPVAGERAAAAYGAIACAPPPLDASAAAVAEAIRRGANVALALPHGNSERAKLAERIQRRLRETADSGGAIAVLATLDALERLEVGEADELAATALVQAEAAVATGHEAVALELFARAARWLARTAHPQEADVVPVLRASVLAELARRRRSEAAPARLVQSIFALAGEELGAAVDGELAQRLRGELAACDRDAAGKGQCVEAFAATSGDLARAALAAAFTLESAPPRERLLTIGSLGSPPTRAGEAPAGWQAFGEGPLDEALHVLKADSSGAHTALVEATEECARLDPAAREAFAAGMTAWLAGEPLRALEWLAPLVARGAEIDATLSDTRVPADPELARGAAWVASDARALGPGNGSAQDRARAEANVAAWAVLARLAALDVAHGPFGTAGD